MRLALVKAIVTNLPVTKIENAFKSAQRRKSRKTMESDSAVSDVPSIDSTEQPYTHFIFFAANPRSGDQRAADFLNKQRIIQCKFDEFGKRAYGHVFNVLEKDDS